MTTATTAPSIWDQLKAPFLPSEIEHLPQPACRDCKEASKSGQGPTCKRHTWIRNCEVCGGGHGSGVVHLDYVGHAGITMRLNEVVGPDDWSWEPAHRDISPDMAALIKAALEAGAADLARDLFESCPAKYTDGGMWIKLTIHGATKLGFGDAAGKQGTNAVKEIIGDGLRNASLRFGVATYLWSKSEMAQILKAGGDLVDDAKDSALPIGQGRDSRRNEAGPEERQAARHEVRQIQAQSAPPQPRGAEPEAPATEGPGEAQTVALRAADCRDADELVRTFKEASARKLLTAPVTLHADLLDVVGIDPGQPVNLGTWLMAAGKYVRANGGMTVTEAATIGQIPTLEGVH